ncbi:MAG TPA: TIM barrel protein [Bryobacteraceae bacterium]|jgi:sugar phosphate isomerase/epimerase|nr:TIM barrel protein [Bryobacteraceae bacterium]
MPASTRRSFVTQAAALLPLSRAAFAKEPLTHNNLGVQLYTVRNVIEKDPAATLKAIQEIGYTEVEATYGNLDKIWSALKETSLKPVSIHVDTDIFMQGGSKLDSTIADLKQRGFSYIVVPYIAPAQRGGADMFKNLAEKLNAAGEKAKAAGLTLCYHNHAFEFGPVGGTTGLQILMSNTQKDLVSLEMDIFWVSVAGNDPVALLKTYSGRVKLLHLKDKAKGIKTQYNENVPKSAFKEVGSGTIDIPAVLAAADAAGVENYFVEQDQTPGDPIASLRKSYQYLSGKFKG